MNIFTDTKLTSVHAKIIDAGGFDEVLANAIHAGGPAQELTHG